MSIQQTNSSTSLLIPSNLGTLRDVVRFPNYVLETDLTAIYAVNKDIDETQRNFRRHALHGIKLALDYLQRDRESTEEKDGEEESFLLYNLVDCLHKKRGFIAQVNCSLKSSEFTQKRADSRIRLRTRLYVKSYKEIERYKTFFFNFINKNIDEGKKELLISQSKLYRNESKNPDCEKERPVDQASHSSEGCGIEIWNGSDSLLPQSMFFKIGSLKCLKNDANLPENRVLFQDLSRFLHDDCPIILVSLFTELIKDKKTLFSQWAIFNPQFYEGSTLLDTFFQTPESLSLELFHSGPEDHRIIEHFTVQALQDVIKTTDAEKIAEKIGYFHYQYAHWTPFTRGSASIGEWLEIILYLYHGLSISYPNSYSVNLHALLTPFHEFIRDYPRFIELKQLPPEQLARLLKKRDLPNEVQTSDEWVDKLVTFCLYPHPFQDHVLDQMLDQLRKEFPEFTIDFLLSLKENAPTSYITVLDQKFKNEQLKKELITILISERIIENTADECSQALKCLNCKWNEISYTLLNRLLSMDLSTSSPNLFETLDPFIAQSDQNPDLHKYLVRHSHKIPFPDLVSKILDRLSLFSSFYAFGSSDEVEAWADFDRIKEWYRTASEADVILLQEFLSSKLESSILTQNMNTFSITVQIVHAMRRFSNQEVANCGEWLHIQLQEVLVSYIVEKTNKTAIDPKTKYLPSEEIFFICKALYSYPLFSEKNRHILSEFLRKYQKLLQFSFSDYLLFLAEERPDFPYPYPEEATFIIGSDAPIDQSR